MRRFLRFLLLLACCLACTLSASANDDGETYFIFDTPNYTSAGGGASANVYLSPAGDDSASGAEDAPLETIHEALSRALAGDSPVVTLWLHGGEYLFEQTLGLRGPTDKEIIFRAYPGETPVLTGAMPITGWTEVDVAGQRLWSATVYAPELRAVYGADGARQPSRWPKDGTFAVTSVTTPAGEGKFQNTRAFHADPGGLPASLDGAYVRLLHWWKDELSAVAAYDPTTGFLQLNRASAMTIEPGHTFWLENVGGVPLDAGEWYYDAAASTLYYAPMEGEQPGQSTLYAGITEELMIFNGVGDIKFDGITFARTGWTIPHGDQDPDFPQAAYDANAAIYLVNGANITFTSCTFRDIGAAAIRLDVGIQNAKIFNCVFENIGAQAIYVHGFNNSFDGIVTENIIIENNEIKGYGRNFLNAAAVLIIHARDIDIGFNEIHDGTYTAISAGWVWGDDYNVTDYVRVRNNLIYNIGQGLLSDLGAVYMLGNQPNSFITGNIIHNVTMAEYGGWGIYLDEGAKGITVQNNLVYRCAAQGFHQHSTGPNTVENNIFAFNRDGQVGLSGDGAFTLLRNIVVGDKPHLNIVGGGSIKSQDNLYRESGSLFIDAAADSFADNFNLRDSTAQDEIGFVPWVFHAGRYAVE